MKAKRKPLAVKSAADFGIDLSARTKLLKVTPPAERQAGIIVETVDELIEKLKNEAKVIS
jgi:electron transfer flavoprotein beta subunit